MDNKEKQENITERMSSEIKQKNETKTEDAKEKKSAKSLQLLVIFLAIIAVLLLIIEYIIYQPENNDEFEETLVENAEVNSGLFCVAMPVYQQKIAVTTDAVNEVYVAESDYNIKEIIEKHKGEGRKDKGLSFKIEFKITNIPENYKISSAEVIIFEKGTAESIRTVELDDNYSAEIYHLKTGTQYTYSLVFYFTNGETATFEGDFETEEGPRFLDIEGLRNVRDVGGWETLDGRKIKQGLLYRGIELDAAVREDYKITQKGIEDMVNILGIKTDMDLRWNGAVTNVSSELGNNIIYEIYDAPSYLQIFEDGNKETMKRIFSDLAKPELYPIYMHCTHGADRTGTMCFLLGALLGVSEENLLKEYELTAFMYSEFSRETIKQTVDVLKSYEGETLQQKVENYLFLIGITKEEIISIKSIFLE